MAQDGRMPYSGLNPPPRFDQWKRRRQRRWIRNNAPPGLEQTPPGVAGYSPQEGANFPAPQNPPPNFLPNTPGFEAGIRGLEDQYSQQRLGVINNQNLIDPMVRQQFERMSTDAGYSANQHVESMADRGLWDSSVNPYLYQRDIAIPYGRGQQDLADWAAQQYTGSASDLGELDLGYMQQLAELYLNAAAESAANLPMNVPQFSQGQQPRIPKRDRNRDRPPRRDRGR